MNAHQHSSKVVSAVHYQPTIELENRLTESMHTTEENVIYKIVKSAVEDRAANKWSPLIDELLDDILRKLIHNGQSRIPSVVYNVDEQMMLDVLVKNVMGDTWDAHIAKFFHTNAAVDKLSQRLLILNTVITPITTFLRPRTDVSMEQKYNTKLATDVIDTV